MALPFPYESADSSRNPLSYSAEVIFQDVVRIARLCTSILASPALLNLKDAAYLVHYCARYVQGMDAFRDSGTGAISNIVLAMQEQIKARAGIELTEAATEQALKDLYTEASSFAPWGAANFPKTNGQNVTAIVVASGSLFEQAEVDQTLASPPAALLTRVQNLRNVFS